MTILYTPFIQEYRISMLIIGTRQASYTSCCQSDTTVYLKSISTIYLLITLRCKLKPQNQVVAPDMLQSVQVTIIPWRLTLNIWYSKYCISYWESCRSGPEMEVATPTRKALIFRFLWRTGAARAGRAAPRLVAWRRGARQGSWAFAYLTSSDVREPQLLPL